MLPNERTQGATLIVSLLLVMLMLAVIMSVTAQVTLSTRRSSADQDAILRAQYAAESGAARVQARLRAAGELIARAKFSQDVLIPQIEADIAAMCGLSSLPTPLEPGETVCNLENRAQGLNDPGPANARVNVLMRAVSAADFAAVGMPGATDADRSLFWSEMFSGRAGVPLDGNQGDATFTVNYGMQPKSVVKSGATGYRLFFEVRDAEVIGEAGGATRRVAVRAAQPPALNLLIQRQSLASYALLTNHHYLSSQAEANGGGIYFTSRTLFSGPVHTNQHFNIVGKPWFGGAVTSHGCPAGQIAEDGTKCNVDPQPGAKLNSTLVSSAAMSPNDQKPSLCNAQGTGCATPDFKGGVRWNVGPVQLPTNGSDQQAQAQAGGIALPGDVSELQLYQDTVGGQTVQRITYTTETPAGPVTTQLALSEAGTLQMLDIDGQWKGAERQPDGSFKPGAASAFNGVLYVAGKVANLNAGPNGASGVAVAPFAGLTLAAAGDINITSSLRYADPPCTGQHVRSPVDGTVTPAPCDNLDARNILGIYSAQGNVNLMKDQMGADPSIHAVLMAGVGAVQVDRHDQGSPMGNMNLVGGIIENYYGAFGTFNEDSPSTGYGRNFVFDPRTLQGFEPPYFPTARSWQMALTDGPEATTPMTTRLSLRGDTVSTAKDEANE